MRLPDAVPCGGNQAGEKSRKTEPSPPLPPRPPPPQRSRILKAYEASFAFALLLLVTHGGKEVAELDLEMILLLPAGTEPLSLICHNTPPPHAKTAFPSPSAGAKSVQGKPAEWRQLEPRGLLRDHERGTCTFTSPPTVPATGET